jgi:hypothetical protein
VLVALQPALQPASQPVLQPARETEPMRNIALVAAGCGIMYASVRTSRKREFLARRSNLQMIASAELQPEQPGSTQSAGGGCPVQKIRGGLLRLTESLKERGSTGRAVRETRLWVERVVVGLSLCPFAKKPSQENAIRYSYSEAGPGEDARIIDELRREIEFLRRPENAKLETTIFVIPNAYPEDFERFCQLAEDAEIMLAEEEIDEDFQAVGFHPLHQFHGYLSNDAGNFTMRSPHPMFHILKQASVTLATEHPDTLNVMDNNQELLASMGVERLQELVDSLREDPSLEADAAAELH